MRVNKKLVTFLVGSVFIVSPLIFTSNVLAEGVSTSTATTKYNMQVKRGETREKMREEITNKLSGIRKERVMSFSSKMIVRLEATVERLEKLITRIDERIKKIEAAQEEIELTSAKKSLKDATVLLNTTKTQIETLKDDLDSMVNSNDPKSDFKEVKISLTTIKDNLKSVHKMLVETIGDIKGLRVGNK